MSKCFATGVWFSVSTIAVVTIAMEKASVRIASCKRVTAYLICYWVKFPSDCTSIANSYLKRPYTVNYLDNVTLGKSNFYSKSVHYRNIFGYHLWPGHFPSDLVEASKLASTSGCGI
jgi:hypothetical protein